MQPKLGILAGGGELPAKLIDICRSTGREVFVVIFGDQAGIAVPGDVEQASVRLGQAGKVLELLHDAGVEEVVMAGKVRRPSVADLKPDLAAAKIFMRLGKSAFGDASLLSVLVDVLTEEGFRVVGAEEIMSDLLAPAGVLGRVQPDAQARKDIAQAAAAARDLGRRGLGQAAIAEQGAILGLEDADGTDALLSRWAATKRAGLGGVLVKIKEPGQDRRVDLPTIGVDTVRNAAAAGLRGIAVEAGAALVLDRDAVITAADESGLFVIGLEAGQ